MAKLVDSQGNVILDTTKYVLFNSTNGEIANKTFNLSDSIDNYERVCVISNVGSLEVVKEHYSRSFRLQRASDSNGSYYAGVHVRFQGNGMACSNYTASNLSILIYQIYAYKY